MSRWHRRPPNQLAGPDSTVVVVAGVSAARGRREEQVEQGQGQGAMLEEYRHH